MMADGNGYTRPSVGVFVMTLLGTSSGTPLRSIFTYDAPRPTFVGSVNVPTDGSLPLTILGNNFGTYSATTTIAVNGLPCVSASWMSTTSSACIGYAGTGKSVALSITVASAVGSLNSLVTYDGPLISSFSSGNQPSTGGGLVSILGLNFAQYDVSLTVSVGRTLCGSTSWSSNTGVSCQILAGAGSTSGRDQTLLTSTVVTDTLTGTVTAGFTFDTPVVSSWLLSNGPTTYGVGFAVPLVGMNFGPFVTSPTARLGNTLCSSTLWVTDTAVTCQWNSNPRTTRTAPVDFALTVSSQVACYSSVFTFDGPVITWANPRNLPTTGAPSLTLQGFNLYADNWSPTVYLGSTICQTAGWISATHLTCQPASGTSVAVAVRVLHTDGQQTSTGSRLFSYDSPL